jgi:4'-phosphopantetheinyl transferase
MSREGNAAELGRNNFFGIRVNRKTVFKFLTGGGPNRSDVPGGAPFVVTARTGDVLRTLDRRLLTAVERRRCAVPRCAADRDARAAAHLLVRWAASHWTGRGIETVELVQRCPGCGSTEHGKPSLRGLPSAHVSLAHTRGAVVVGVADRPLGVDIETVGAVRDIAGPASSLLLSGAEIRRVRSAPDPARAFLRHWTLKECLVKVGVTTLDTAAEVGIDPGTVEAADNWTVSRHGPLHLVDWFDESLDAVVAVAGSAPPRRASFPMAGPGVPGPHHPVG